MSAGIYTFRDVDSAPIIISSGHPYVWVSRRNDNGETVVWRTESSAKRAFESGSHGLYWKKAVQE